MASRALPSTSFLLTLNLLFFTLVTCTKSPKSCPPPPKSPTPSPCPPPPKPPTTTPCPPPPTKTPTVPSTSPKKVTCPKNTLNLGVCANLLNGLLPIVIETPSNTPCCSLIGGLADLDVVLCLCTAIKANVVGINLNVPVSLSVLLNYCRKKAPSVFQCA